MEAASTKKKRAMLPVLTVLFLISYGLMTMLIVEQGSTIESQRTLIRELFRDSKELAAVKTRSVQDQKIADPQQRALTQAPSHQTPSTQAPSSQLPSVQAPSTQNQTPSTQARTQHSAQSKPEKTQKFQLPSKPAPDLIDDRRALITI
jgi:hypothetical protein